MLAVVMQILAQRLGRIVFRLCERKHVQPHSAVTCAGAFSDRVCFFILCWPCLCHQQKLVLCRVLRGRLLIDSSSIVHHRMRTPLVCVLVYTAAICVWCLLRTGTWG
jgi:hypothetical protein